MAGQSSPKKTTSTKVATTSKKAPTSNKASWMQTGEKHTTKGGVTLQRKLGAGQYFPATQGNAFSRLTTNLQRQVAALMPKDMYQSRLQQLVQPDAITAPMGADLGGTNGGGGRGGGGGGGGGPSPEQVRAWADELYGFNAQPYGQMRSDVEAQKAQAMGYNPDFAGMQAGYDQRLAKAEQDRSAQVSQRLQELVGVGQQLAGQQGTALQGALRDLSAQGVNPSGYIDQANRMGAERTQGLSNQAGYMGQLNAAGANSAADYARSGGLIRQGGEATLANNRGQMMNTLQQSLSQIGLQEAQARQANDQARREFLIRYGVS